MKFHLSCFLLLVLVGCASLEKREGSKSVPVKNSPDHGQTRVEKSSPAPQTVWELLKDQHVTLQFKNVDNGKKLTVILNQGLKFLPVPVGHWELTGFERRGESFVSMKTSKKFVFRVKAKQNTYAGSILIGCPTVSEKNFTLLKEMKFFNRYPFSSESNLCELVVGDDLKRVQSELKRTKENKHLKLFLSF